ncbi:hypothetical protein A2617_00290 [Candidatus Daviesbacteria bacterium RIFOXYD1_FULL_41_10]|uniref:Uncharacterized protein n=2 Tax=Candidatus Daviesiibacteriota TaxID=1752718 RepID=A0A1F5MZN1_9BACT|nr:MAG: hypothetical protein UU67_C0015G0009 [Candidatus Daviesbacteria bacterium GW2011_GWB1_41_5]OGE70856.1 MAG: hypothetical protein A2617_00290 [Candidatus Daviesbacteria bacterium RIFOXYD1_FULL_41_10]
MKTFYNDITIIFLTLNKVPKKWVPYHREMLEKAADGAPIISVSREPMDFGTNIIQTEPASAVNIYWQTLKAAKIATTPYIAIAEDDTLYPREHYHGFRPSLDTFAYNKTRWGLNTWGLPIYYHAQRASHMTLIAPRKLAVEALEERFNKYPIDNAGGKNAGGELGKQWMEERLGVTLRKSVEFYTSDPVMYFQHIESIDPLNVNRKKRMSRIRALEIPYWGRSEDMIKKFV